MGAAWREEMELVKLLHHTDLMRMVVAGWW